MKAFVFPGQGAQFPGMGKALYEENPEAKALFEKANEILGFRITDIMFEGSEEELKQTKVTQPAIFLHSVVLAKTTPDGVRWHTIAGKEPGQFGPIYSALLELNKNDAGDGVVGARDDDALDRLFHAVEFCKRRIDPHGAVHEDAPEPCVFRRIDHLGLAYRGEETLVRAGVRNGIVAAKA